MANETTEWKMATALAGMYTRMLTTDGEWDALTVSVDTGPQRRYYRKPVDPTKYKCSWCGTTQKYNDALHKGSCIRCGAPLEDIDE